MNEAERLLPRFPLAQTDLAQLIGVCRRPSIPSAPSLARTRQAGLELLGDFGVLQDDGARVLHPRVDVLVVAVDQFGVEPSTIIALQD